MTIKVKQLINDNNRPAANQFVLSDDNGCYIFQSYSTTIAKVEDIDDSYTVTLDIDALDYSRTTSKHLYIWLRDYTRFDVHNKQDVLKLIKDDKVKTEVLN